MRSLQYFIITIAGLVVLASCEKKSYPKGVDELAHHYYAIFVPNNNTPVSVPRSQTALLKFPVQFYSTYTRDYDAVAKYAVTTYGIANPAQRGVDYNIVDKNGTVITSTDSTYSIVFPKAIQKMDTIYIKLLNNPATGARRVDILMLANITPQFTVDFFSTANRRPLTIN
ncbi:MAG TPA: hypothetical protein VF476_09660 [Chitinophagaceae bacterium]